MTTARPVLLPPAPLPADSLSRRTLGLLALALLMLGLLWRTARYLLQFPIWGDEALLAINFALFDSDQLMLQLKNCQIAPLLFLWAQRAAYVWLGSGELAMRLFPYLAGVASLLFYWHLTGLLLSPQARLLAVGFLAVAIWPVSMGTLIKPYSFDLLMALILLVPAAHWLRQPTQSAWLVALTLLAPVALLGSYPAAFVGGAVSLALLLPVWRAGWSARSWFVAYNLALFTGFAVAYWVGHNQLATPAAGVTTREGMTTYWAGAFPPTGFFPTLWWLVLQLSGQIMAYPIGAANGGSVVTLVCVLAGLMWWIRRGQWPWVILFLAPLVLNLLAAALHRYPFGPCRLGQHLAPGLCLLAGLGSTALLQRLVSSELWQARGLLAAFTLFALIGSAGLVADFTWPYRDRCYIWTREVAAQDRAQRAGSVPLIVCAHPDHLECVFTWYWLTDGRRISWDFHVPADIQAEDRAWGFYHGDDPTQAAARLEQQFQKIDPRWRLVQRSAYVYLPQRGKTPPQRCEFFLFRRVDDHLASVVYQERITR